MLGILLACAPAMLGILLVCALVPLGCAAARGDIEDAERRLVAELKEVLNRGSCGSSQNHFREEEMRLRRIFSALPQNELGRISPITARYALQTYLMREYGWLVAGLEPNGMRSVEAPGLHAIDIITDRAPALKRILEVARPPHCGYSLEDIVVVLAAVERLVLDESKPTLVNAYYLNNQSRQQEVTETKLAEILTSYLWLYRRGDLGNFTDPALHATLKAEKFARSRTSKEPSAVGWMSTPVLVQDAIRNFAFGRRMRANPFRPRTYSFKEALCITEDIVRRFGRWQDDECRSMQALLRADSKDSKDTGRIPLASFYKAGEYFNEAPEYLRQIGAMDEAIDGHPMVSLTNYLQGPMNCVADVGYTCTCCMNHCLNLMNELESTIQLSYATADQLLAVLSNYSDTPRHSVRLITKLRGIEALHGGRVPLHSRLFAQWLHAAMPRICPYPQVIRNLSVLSRRYIIHGPGQYILKVNPMDRLRYTKEGPKGDPPVSTVLDHWWTDEESLPLGGLPPVPEIVNIQEAIGFSELIGQFLGWSVKV